MKNLTKLDAPCGLTEAEYVTLALDCLDQAGLTLAEQETVRKIAARITERE